MQQAVQNSVFQQVFVLTGITAPTVDAEIFDVNGLLVANKVMSKVEGGYLFQHSFADLGLFTVKCNGVIDTITVRNIGKEVFEGYSFP